MNINSSLLNTKEGYCLKLANGQRWHIVATEEVSSWLRKLARIMELNRCDSNGYTRIIFQKKSSKARRLCARIFHKSRCPKPFCSRDPNILDGLPRSGWKAFKLSSIKFLFHSDVPDVILEIGSRKNHTEDVMSMWQALFPIYKKAQETGGLPFHAALIERNGMGLLLAARGGIGKSTCCRRLSNPWRVLCDDETLVVRDDKKKYLVHPFPTWGDYIKQRSERTWNVQQSVPLAAIFFLEWAEADEVVPLGQGKAAALINQSALQAYRQNLKNLDIEELRNFMIKLFENACELAKSIPVFKLRVSPNGRFWEEMEKVL